VDAAPGDPTLTSATSASGEPDGVVRALTDDGTFRVIAVRTTETVRGAVNAQAAMGATASLLADLVTGAILVRESMAPDLRVQVIVQSAEQRTRLIADAHPDGTSRGLVQRPAHSPDVTLRAGDLFQVARTLHNGALQQGTVAVAADGGVSQALMQYMQLSEQIVTMCAVGCQRDGDQIIVAGGYLVQLLPEVLDPSGPLLVMTERLRDFESMETLLAQGLTSPSKLLRELLYAMPYSIVAESTLRFGCQCNSERVALALSTLPKSEIEDLLRQDTATELSCDYCGKAYAFQKSHLRGLLDRN
jgi:molecular chaperone Hsp33